MTPYRLPFWDMGRDPSFAHFFPVVSYTETTGFTGLKPPVSDMAETAGFSLKPSVSDSSVVSRQSAGHQWQSFILARRRRFVGVGGPRRLSKLVDRPGGDLGLRGSNPQIHTAFRGIVKVRPRSVMTWPRLAVGELDSGRRFGTDAETSRQQLFSLCSVTRRDPPGVVKAPQ